MRAQSSALISTTFGSALSYWRAMHTMLRAGQTSEPG